MPIQKRLLLYCGYFYLNENERKKMEANPIFGEVRLSLAMDEHANSNTEPCLDPAKPAAAPQPRWSTHPIPIRRPEKGRDGTDPSPSAANCRRRRRLVVAACAAPRNVRPTRGPDLTTQRRVASFDS